MEQQIANGTYLLPKVGARIRVSTRHWLRANATGTIAVFDGKRGDNRYLIEFDQAWVGGGFDGGRCLWLSEHQFTEDGRACD